MIFAPRRVRLDRRAFLRGVGATVALPWLSAMTPAFARAANREDRPGAAARLLCVYVPNGVHLPGWVPKKEGPDFDLPPTLEPLAAVREHVRVLSGLALDAALAHGDGPGDHARAAAAFLTCAHPYKTGGAGVKVGVSFDQIAAEKLGAGLRLRSLALGAEAGRASGDCDSGYACAYVGNVSWRTPTTPAGKETDPRAVFARLFGSSTPEERANRASVLDVVLEDAKRLQGALGGPDRERLDEYLTAVRELEARLLRDAKDADSARAAAPPEPPKDYAARIDLMYELLALAFEADVVRVASFMHANEGSNRGYPEIGAPEGHHDLSHHGKDPERRRKTGLVDRFHTEALARFLKRLGERRDGERTLLERAMIVYGSGIGDGDRHNHDELPILLCGGGDGALKAARHARFPRGTPLANLHLALLDRLNVRVATFADATGRLDGI